MILWQSLCLSLTRNNIDALCYNLGGTYNSVNAESQMATSLLKM